MARMKRDNTTIRNKFSFAYLAALIVPMIVVGSLFIIGVTTMLRQYNQDLLSSDNQRVHAILFELTTQAFTLSDDICDDDEVIHVLEGDYSSGEQFREEALKCDVLTRAIDKNAFIDKMKIYTTVENSTNTNNFVPAEEEIQENDWYRKALTQTRPFWQVLTEKDKYGNEYAYLSLIRRIPILHSDSEAVLVIYLSDNYLKARISTNEYYTVISLNDGSVFFSNNNSLYGKKFPYSVDYSDSYYKYVGLITLDKNKYLSSISSFNLYQADSTIFLCVYSLDAYRNQKTIILIYILTIVLAIGLPGILMHQFIYHFSDRVEALRETVHKVSNEDYDLSVPITGNDELADVYKDIDIMVSHIQSKQAEYYQVELNAKELRNEQQAMEYKMLASQINPHFLYNTLETIRMKALKAGNREVGDAIKLLGKSMRYVLENTGTSATALQNELEYVKTYLKIQKLRFEDRVNYSINIEDDIDVNGLMILPLLLQPVVENAISHGLEKVMENGQIDISISTGENDCLKISVADNGSGLDEEELAQIRTKLDTAGLKLNQNIGLYNIHQRIKLYYGNEYGILLESEKGKGTVVTLFLPKVNT